MEYYLYTLKLSMMMKESSFSNLQDFAEKCIHASNYPDDVHNFKTFQCSSCHDNLFKISVEHHTGSEEWSFKGIIWGTCVSCGYIMRLFTFTGEHRSFLREEHPECECMQRDFMVGLCERYEGEQGIQGFFDEGVFVVKCAHCHRNQAIVYTD